MDVEFRNQKLRRQYESGKERRKYPPEVGRRYVQRVSALYDAADWSAIERFRTFHAHRLTGDREGQWALTLTGRWRLIVTVSGDVGPDAVVRVSRHSGSTPPQW